MTAVKRKWHQSRVRWLMESNFFIENVDNLKLKLQTCEHMIGKDCLKTHEINTKGKFMGNE